MRPEHEEEYEVLESIYEGDPSFTTVNHTTFQYKYEGACENKSFIVEIEWGSEYPDAAPKINLDLFFNKHLLPEVKQRIISGLEEQAEINLGMSMTFTLIEWLKEAKEELLEEQLRTKIIAPSTDDLSNEIDDLNLNEDNVKKKKEILTKSQKRRMWDRQNAAGEKERGYNWVDLVKHLSQTGNGNTD